jgi:hypothetical protein
VLLGEEPAERCAIRLLERRPGALEEAHQLQQIPLIRNHRVRREVALQPEVVGERAHEMELGRGKGVLFHEVSLRARRGNGRRR